LKKRSFFSFIQPAPWNIQLLEKGESR